MIVGDEGSQSPHNFKSTSFSIPTTCGYCKVSTILSYIRPTHILTRVLVVHMGVDQTGEDMQDMRTVCPRKM